MWLMLEISAFAEEILDFGFWILDYSAFFLAIGMKYSTL